MLDRILDIIRDELFKLKDEKYANFQRKLIPGLKLDRLIGVRIPKMRKLAKKLEKNENFQPFFEELPHKYYDEDILHAVLISNVNAYEKCLELLNLFLPYVNNWAVCDCIRPKIFKNYKSQLIFEVEKWINSKRPYICRFGIEMLMIHYLGENFKSMYLELPLKIKTNEYYTNMGIAWLYASALAEHWTEAITYIENKKLPIFVHNKTISKAIDSFKITNKQKEYLKTLKI